MVDLNERSFLRLCDASASAILYKHVTCTGNSKQQQQLPETKLKCTSTTCVIELNVVLTLERNYAARHYNIASVRLTEDKARVVFIPSIYRRQRIKFQ